MQFYQTNLIRFHSDKEDKFYRFSEYSRYDGRSYGSWKLEMYWPGIPKSPDAAIQWKNGEDQRMYNVYAQVCTKCILLFAEP